MKRAVLCVKEPHLIIPQLDAYSIMIINPDSTKDRLNYLLSQADWSVLITDTNIQYRNGSDYPNERVLWYTSGTTGDSKFYGFTQNQIDHLAKTICNSYDITPNDRYTGIMGLWHAHGQGFYWATKYAQCETNFISVKDIKSWPKNQPTFLTAIPDVLNAATFLKFDNLRFIRSASASMPDRTYIKLKEKFKIPVIEAFGMTEAFSHCFTNPLHGEQRMGTVGLPDGIEAKVNNGHLLIRGPSVFTNDWFDTGDLVEQDEFGYFKILGRSRDQINIKGYKFNPLSLEQQISNVFPEITEIVVFGSTTIKCLYVGDVPKEKLQTVFESFEKNCRPTLLKQVDLIPKNNTGKISRALLDSMF
jgi:acyl-coenzyme A synthetase/AMP-(fatty) acid ligase